VYRCEIWDDIADLRAQLYRAVEAHRSYSHPSVIDVSVDLDTRLNMCRRCAQFPCVLVQRHQATWMSKLL